MRHGAYAGANIWVMSLYWQMIWAESYLLGCSRAMCEQIKNVFNTDFHKSMLTVCYYGPTFVAYTDTSVIPSF